MSASFGARTIPEILLEARQQHGSRPAVALRDPVRGVRWTYDDLVAFAAGVARWLSERGIGAGERVIL